jgi:hypothetical protein
MVRAFAAGGSSRPTPTPCLDPDAGLGHSSGSRRLEGLAGLDVGLGQVLLDREDVERAPRRGVGAGVEPEDRHPHPQGRLCSGHR